MGTEPWKGRKYIKQDDEYPAVHISWSAAQDFILKLNLQDKNSEYRYRLPTESEWEYACRAGSSTAYYWGDSMDDRYCWYKGNSGGQGAQKVKTKRSNSWGLYDMSGNVLEWCSDRYGDYPSGEVTDPQGVSSGQYRVLRGGSWDSNPQHCRSAYRYWDHPGPASSCGGFRIVRALKK